MNSTLKLYRSQIVFCVSGPEFDFGLFFSFLMKMFFCVCLEEANWYWLRPMALGLWAQVVLLAISWSLVLCCRSFLFRRPNDPWNLRDSPSIFLGNNHGIYCNPPAIGWWTVGWSRSVSCISAPLGGGLLLTTLLQIIVHHVDFGKLERTSSICLVVVSGFRFPVSGFISFR